MCCVAVGLDRGGTDLAALVFEELWFLDGDGTVLDGVFPDASDVVYRERDVFDTIAVFGEVCMDLIQLLAVCA